MSKVISGVEYEDSRMTEYIEREAAKDELLSWAVCINHPKHLMREDAIYVLDAIPASDVALVRHGRWGVDGVYVVCSVCKRFTLSPIIKQTPTFKYCPNCGAKMDGGIDDG